MPCHVTLLGEQPHLSGSALWTARFQHLSRHCGAPPGPTPRMHPGRRGDTHRDCGRSAEQVTWRSNCTHGCVILLKYSVVGERLVPLRSRVWRTAVLRRARRGRGAAAVIPRLSPLAARLPSARVVSRGALVYEVLSTAALAHEAVAQGQEDE
jgi:hypothetical protein